KDGIVNEIERIVSRVFGGYLTISVHSLKMESSGTSFNAAMRSVAPHQEFLLQGSILDAHCEVLLHRLRGLCDNADCNPEQFSDYEAVYQLKNNLSTQQSQYILFRIRQALDHADAPWHIRYLGQAEVGDKNRHTLVRACYDVACSSNVREFLNELGF
ncbi:hypothetical protein BaRGS_00022309, partial [Batillaria attramentaria]